MYSAYDRVAMGLSALAAGADEYFQKAATVGQLVEQLRRAFPGRSMHINTPSAGLDGAAEPLPLQRESLRGAAPATDQRFRALLDALEQGVLITDPVAVVTDANTAATRILQGIGSAVVSQFRYARCVTLRSGRDRAAIFRAGSRS